MAIIVKNEYPTRIGLDKPEYPLGYAINLVNGVEGTGTPLEARWLNDDWGFKQAILQEAGLTPSGNPDTAFASDYLTALKLVIAGSAATGPRGLQGFVGERGEQGFTGEKAFYIVRKYTRSVFKPATPLVSPSIWLDSPSDAGIGHLWEAFAGYNSNDERSSSWTVVRLEGSDTAILEEILTERKARKNMERTIFDVTSDYANWRQEYESRTLLDERLIDASVYIDPDSGIIINRAYAYSDEQFTEAGILINGVDARVLIEAGRISATEKSITQAKASIVVEAGRIDQRATYTEITSEIAGAIAALTPAYSWQFNSSEENFTGHTSWNPLGYIVQVSTTPVVTPVLVLDTSTDFIFRIKVKLHVAGTWNGVITIAGGTIPVEKPVDEDVWTIITVDASGATGYTGTLTSLTFDLGDVDIDAIEVGKRGSNDQALSDLTVRATTLESEMDAVEGTIINKADTTWVTDQGYQTDIEVGTIIDSHAGMVSVLAQKNEFDSNNTLTKANSAATWVDGANSNIRSEVIQYNIDENIPTAANFNAVTSELDAVAGTIKNQVISINGLKRSGNSADEVAMQLAYRDFLLANSLETDKIRIATAERTLLATTTSNDATAQELLLLSAQSGDLVSSVTELSTAYANNLSGFAEYRKEVAVSLNGVLADSQEYTRVAIGYCVDNTGKPTNHTSDAVVCVADGYTWLPTNAIAEAVKNTTITTTAGVAKVSTLMQTFETETGNLVARAALELDVNNRLSGIYLQGTNNHTDLEFVSDTISFVKPVSFEKALYWDAGTDQLTLKGAIILPDDTQISSVNDIRALDGQGSVTGFAFKRSATDLTETPEGGSFSSPNPTTTGWEDGIPTGTDPVYMSTRLFTSNGLTPQAAAWAQSSLLVKDGYSPIKGTDYDDGVHGNNVRVEYSENGTSDWTVNLVNGTHKYIRTAVDSKGDGNYIGGGAAKFVPEEGIEYTVTNGVPSYLHIKYSNDNSTFTTSNGEDLGNYIGTLVNATLADSLTFADYTWSKYIGDDGTSTSIQFSVDKSSWHTTPATADIWMRTGTKANGASSYTYDGAVKIKGEQGLPSTVAGPAGNGAKIQFSADDSTWGDTAQSGDKYIRSCTNTNGGSWVCTGSSLIKGATGTANQQYKIRLPDGTAIKNGTGSVTIYATSILGSVQTDLTSGSIVLYVDGISANVGFSETFNAAAINGSVDIVLKHASTGFIYDSITLIDVSDGVDAFQSYMDWTGSTIVSAGTWNGQSNARVLSWVQANNGGAWSPSADYSEFDTVFVKAGVEIARRRTVVKREGSVVNVVYEQAVSQSTGYGTTRIWTGRSTASMTIVDNLKLSSVDVYKSQPLNFTSVKGGTEGGTGNIGNGVSTQFSSDGTNWHSPAVNGDTLVRYGTNVNGGAYTYTPSGGINFEGPKGDLGLLPPPSGTPSGLYMTSTNLGYVKAGAWATYMGADGDFFLKGTDNTKGLSWDASTNTLAVKGDITGSTGTFSGDLGGAGGTFNGTLQVIGANYMTLSSGVSFGKDSNNQFLEWTGPKSVDANGQPIMANVTSILGIKYFKSNGQAYFGGTVLIGGQHNEFTEDSLSDTASLAVNFPMAGKPITIVFVCNYYSEPKTTTSPINVNATGTTSMVSVLERKIGSTGSYSTVATINGSGNYAISSESVGGIQFAYEGSSSASGQVTYTDTLNTAGTAYYRMRLVSISEGHSFFVKQSQNLSISTQEA